MNGRAYHFFPTASNVDPSGGLSYFIFDLPEAVRNHGAICNRYYDGRFQNIDEGNLMSLSEELRIVGMELGCFLERDLTPPFGEKLHYLTHSNHQ